MMFINSIYSIFSGYEETFTISQLSPKSVINERLQSDVLLETSQLANLAFSVEPSDKYYDIEFEPEDLQDDRETENHVIVERSVEPYRGSRSINADEIPSSNNNEIDNELEIHNKRKYYDIVPTKTLDFLNNDEAILMSTGFGDKLDFKFPGEGKRAPKGRALAPPGPKIRPTAVHPPIFATTDFKDQGRQNSEIQNIITGIVKLLNGNVNVQANTQLLNGRPRPMASRINNRGPPRITDIPSVPDYDKPITPPSLPFHPTKIPPPYPFDRPHGVNLPEQIVPPMNNRPLIRPIPPWQRPRPRPNPNRRPNPGLPIYKPTLIPPPDIPEDDKYEIVVNENETHSENNIHHDEVIPFLMPESTTEVTNVTEIEKEMTTESTTTSTDATTTTTTTKKPETTTEKPTEPTTHKTTEKPKTEKPSKPEKDKKKETSPEKDKSRDKYKVDGIEKIRNDTPIIEIEPSIVDVLPTTVLSDPTPTDGLEPTFITYTTFVRTSTEKVIETSSINKEPSQSEYFLSFQHFKCVIPYLKKKIILF